MPAACPAANVASSVDPPEARPSVSPPRRTGDARSPGVRLAPGAQPDVRGMFPAPAIRRRERRQADGQRNWRRDAVQDQGIHSAAKRTLPDAEATPERRAEVKVWIISGYPTTRSEPGPTANPSLLNGDSDRRALRARYNSAEGCLYWTIGWPPL
jgi:hypothetical protein